MQDLDKSGYRKILLSFAEQLDDARRLAERLNIEQLKSIKSSLRQIVYCGMGGSAIAGDFLRTLMGPHCPIPITVLRDYGIPAHIGRDTLVILSSYSGSTEETLSAAQLAIERGCFLVTLSTGGLLRERTKDRTLLHIELPNGYMPRQALAYPLIALYHVLTSLFEAPDIDSAIDESVRLAEKETQRLSRQEFFKALLHPPLLNQPIVIYSSEQLFPAALRWKGQICENAKLLAFANTVPEVNHNEIMGWETIIPASSSFGVILLRDPNDHPRVRKRFDFMSGFLKTRTHVFETEASGQSPLCRMVNWIQLGDWFSYHLAIARGVDPSPIRSIGELKAFMST